MKLFRVTQLHLLAVEKLCCILIHEIRSHFIILHFILYAFFYVLFDNKDLFAFWNFSFLYFIKLNYYLYINGIAKLTKVGKKNIC